MWTYKQSTGEIFCKNSEALEKGYAGKGEDKNNPLSQKLIGRGPLPRGLYIVGPAENHPKLGPCAMPLKPDSENEMFGRSDFWIHGDSITRPGEASEGCIILSNALRKRISVAKDKYLVVIT